MDGTTFFHRSQQKICLWPQSTNRHWKPFATFSRHKNVNLYILAKLQGGRLHSAALIFPSGSTRSSIISWCLLLLWTIKSLFARLLLTFSSLPPNFPYQLYLFWRSELFVSGSQLLLHWGTMNMCSATVITISLYHFYSYIIYIA